MNCTEAEIVARVGSIRSLIERARDIPIHSDPEPSPRRTENIDRLSALLKEALRQASALKLETT